VSPFRRCAPRRWGAQTISFEALDAVAELADVDNLDRLGRALIARCGSVEGAIGMLALGLLELTGGTMLTGPAGPDEWDNRWPS